MTVYKQVAIRDALADDVEAITALHNSVIEEGLLTWSTPRTVAQTSEEIQHLDGLDYPHLLAVSEDEVIASATLSPVWDTLSDVGCMYSAKLEIVVHVARRKEGIAGRLFEELRKHPRTIARGLYCIRCKVLDINVSAVEWLESSGFHYDGSLEGIVVKGDRSLDYLHFSKLICPSPDVTGLGFPDLSLPSPYPSKEFALPIDPDAIHIRDAVMDDLPAIVGILNSAILHTDAIDYSIPLEVSERTMWLSDLLVKDLPCLVAVVDECIVGYVCLGEYSSDDCFRYTLELSMYVRRQLMRQRIGQHMWKAVLQHRAIKSRGIRTIVADVHHNNGPGSGSVLKIGFTPQVSTSHAFFKHGELQSCSKYQYDVLNERKA